MKLTIFGINFTDKELFDEESYTLVKRGRKMKTLTIPDEVMRAYQIRKLKSGREVYTLGINTIPINLDISAPEWPADYSSNMKLKPHQEPIVDECMARFSGTVQESGMILKLEAGNGKTYISCKLIELLKVKTLIIAPNATLTGWLEALSNFPNICVGFYNGKKKMDGDVVIMTVTSAIKNRFKFKSELSYIQYFKQFGFVIYDEVHNYTSEKYSKILWRTCFRYRLGLSATPEEAKFEQLLYWNIGDLFDANEYIKSIKWPGEVIVVKYNKHVEPVRNRYNLVNFGATLRLFEDDPDRNEIIQKYLLKLYDMGRNILVFSEHVSHCEMITEWAKLITPDVVMFADTVTNEAKELAKTSRIIVATYSYAREGVSYKQLDSLIMATPRKSRMTQILPRIMRLGGDSSVKRIYVDIVDSGDNFRAQYWERRKPLNGPNLKTERRLHEPVFQQQKQQIRHAGEM